MIFEIDLDSSMLQSALEAPSKCTRRVAQTGAIPNGAAQESRRSHELAGRQPLGSGIRKMVRPNGTSNSE
jgi:hypothetical protein